VKLPMTLRLEALERRRRENAAWVSGVSRRAIATAARLAAEEDAEN
jgi:broad specificity phosphatase PhoE